MDISPEHMELRDAILAALKRQLLRMVRPGQRKVLLPFGVGLVRSDSVAMTNHCFEEPLAGITLQGRKIIRVGQSETALLPGSLMVTCVDVPSVSTIIESSHENPYLSAYVRLNRQTMADLLLHGDLAAAAPGQYDKFWVESADLEILDAFRRLLRALEKAENAQLAGLIARELHLLILSAPQSGLLRQLYLAGGTDNRITGVIVWLRANLQTSVSMEHLARMAHMSVSTFHRHFKQITGMSPLQYHKQLRLYEAQRLMLAENEHASGAALAVGYESVTQFSREYRRLFGAPPGRDIARRRRELVTGASALQAS
ncbi:MAG: AraC family transcriptional regulator [Desulfovibrio sp.]|nr:AraC family transcriptional regulator [Desulfovibrio sp.]